MAKTMPAVPGKFGSVQTTASPGEVAKMFRPHKNKFTINNTVLPSSNHFILVAI